MTKFAILFAGLLGLAACQTTGNGQFDPATNPTMGDQVASPTDGIASNEDGT
ncbi:hypothetical protein PARPLA_02442 [Rhodobacteraceae bacterium THAF1]|uniref:hypothetical protein n=1 Tax=Palleronia sp. THAF1 TaxID=2587842 RepID=UPI000F41DDC4|nr:hypothetical protein [Palleronia sp. THAF1]QFU09252.1 hypothetical protein FIU81_11260 [Palleronia sp. THAF1]VDC27379.1 hypothetical protein PARPLA_02442 [Rhodobacteraceae bacterium THAF1]